MGVRGAADHQRPGRDGPQFRKRVDAINLMTRARLISGAELQEKMKKGERIAILDVREPKEMQVSALPGARLAVPDQIETMPLTEIPADATMVTYCAVGGRSGKAAVLLERRLGRPVYNLDGGIVEWFNRGGEVVDPSGERVDRIDAWGEPSSANGHTSSGDRGIACRLQNPMAPSCSPLPSCAGYAGAGRA